MLSLRNAIVLSIAAAIPLCAAESQFPQLQFELEKARWEAKRVVELKSSLPSGWRIVAHQPLDEIFVPFRAELTVAGESIGQPSYPKADTLWIEAMEGSELFYLDSIRLSFPPYSAEKAVAGEATLHLTYQACNDDGCSEELELQQQFNLSTTSVAKHSILLLLLFALLGGFILNIMPCVLPVLSIKLFKLVEESRLNRKELIASGVAYTAGVLLSFWLLAALVVAIKQGGEQVGWGFQMQSPGFVLSLTIVVTLFALNLFGLFEITLGHRTSTQMEKATRRSGLWGSFAHGVFLALLSTPCSAPLLGSSIGWALAQSKWTIFAFYTAAAIGLALPYLLIALVPSLLRWLPQPGQWMVRVKELMGFLLLATALWLLWVLSRFSSDLALWSGLFSLLLAIVIWTHHHLLPYGGIGKTALFRWSVRLALLSLLLLFLFALLLPELSKGTPTSSSRSALYNGNALPFHPSRIDSLNALGEAVFVDLTADWCLTCKANEKLILSNPALQKRFRLGKPHLMVGDYTHKEPLISAELAKWGKGGVPTYIYYPAQGEPFLFPEVLTVEMVLRAFESSKNAPNRNE